MLEVIARVTPTVLRQQRTLCNIIGGDSPHLRVADMDVNAALNDSPSTAAAPDVTRKFAAPLLAALLSILSKQ